MNEEILEQIAGSINGLQAQVNALKIVNQVFQALVVTGHSDPMAFLENWRLNSTEAIKRFESYGVDPEGDEKLRQRMELFSFDYLDEIAEALQNAQPRTPEEKS